MNLTKKEIKLFQQKVLAFYTMNGRQFPWRETTNPYAILVSELMLQQTQIDRVLPKYIAFMKQFPSFTALAQASVEQVFQFWHGLGYNRRALFLLRCAQEVTTKYNGKLPTTLDELQSLPGIGPYTAAAISAFAFNRPTIVIETNIRTVFIHEFLHDQEGIPDNEITPLIEQTLDYQNPRVWYWALMDYGAMIKKQFGNASRKSKHYTIQSKFEGSNRQIRGLILKTLLTQPGKTVAEIVKIIGRDPDKITKNLALMTTEGFIKIIQNCYFLAS